VRSKDLRSIRNFMAERDCPLGIVVNNDESVRLYDETLLGVPFLFL